MTATTPIRDWQADAETLRHHARMLSALADAAEEKALGKPQGPSLATKVIAAEINTRQRLATEMFEARRRREAFFDSEMFGEPAWDILLKLYALDAIGRAWRPAKEVLSYAGATPTTATRWLGTLVEAGLIERDKTDLDRRLALYRITESGLSLMHKYLGEITENYTPILTHAEAMADR
jgi:DNA-binding MarR family transcriptional regulator